MKAGWEVKTLGEVCGFVRGPFGGSLKKEIFTSSGYAVYEQQHAIYNQFNDIRYFVDQAKTGENSGKIKLHYFKHQDPGAFVSISGGGVLASSKHPKQAQEFVKWITSKSGQDILRTNTAFEYAVGVDAASNPKLVPLKDLQAPTVEPSKLNSKKVVELMTEAGLL